MAQTDLSIHLLGSSPGREIDDTELSYPHRADQHYGFELAADLTRDHPELTVRITSDADRPADSWGGFEDLVRQAQDLIVLFGRVEPEWVKGRVERAFK